MERVEEILEDEFQNPADPKVGNNVKDLKEPDLRMVVGFFNPNFHPEKPKRLVSRWASTFIGAFRGKTQVDWVQLLADVVS